MFDNAFDKAESWKRPVRQYRIEKRSAGYTKIAISQMLTADAEIIQPQLEIGHHFVKRVVGGRLLGPYISYCLDNEQRKSP
jgi:hypothetical protein